MRATSRSYIARVRKLGAQLRDKRVGCGEGELELGAAGGELRTTLLPIGRTIGVRLEIGFGVCIGIGRGGGKGGGRLDEHVRAPRVHTPTAAHTARMPQCKTCLPRRWTPPLQPPHQCRILPHHCIAPPRLLPRALHPPPPPPAETVH
ncbi:hypothetical protein B0H14DRAFT_3437406 [Mycena olivaceomarginata]|nr:hypothetical protein B0H14DRAFT_3437406 [Mycena olivaceomarginata]